MTKKIIAALGVILVVICGYYTFRLFEQTRIPGSLPTASTSTPAQTTSNTATTSTSTALQIPFDNQKFFADEVPFNDNVTKFTAPVTKDVVSFTLLKGEIYQAPNPSYDVYVNGTKIGQMGGLEKSMTGFSPDGRYFAVRSTFVCGTGCTDMSLYVIDLKDLKLLTLNSPSGQVGEKLNTHQQYQDVTPFIESYAWGQDNDIKITTYAVAQVGIDTYYQITPKEIWDYNLVTHAQTVTPVVTQ